jgi:7-cyano-7-deazaguanine reductase
MTRSASPGDRNMNPEKIENPAEILEVFENPNSDRDYAIRINIPEFTCLCPKTGQPDFATLNLEYIPDERCIELKSLKLYIWAFRNVGAFHEAVTNRVQDDITHALQPRFLRLTALFNVRGGIETSVITEYRAQGWTPEEPVSMGDSKQI